MKKHNSPPMAVTRLLRDVLRGPDRAERMRVSRLLGGASHDVFLVRWPGEPLEGLNAVTVRLNRDGSARQRTKSQHEAQALAKVGGWLGPRLLWFDDEGEWLEKPAMCLEFLEGEARVLHDATPGDLEALGKAVGELHNIEPAPGFLVDARPVPDATYARELLTWYERELLQKPFPGSRGGPAHVEDQGVERQIHEDAAAAFAVATASLERSAKIEHFGQQGSWSLLHDDLVEQNIVWGADGEPRFIDWEDTRIGDPAEELAYIVSEADLSDFRKEHLWRGYSATRPNADLDGVRLRMAYWGPIVAMASIRWWLDSVVRIKRGETRAAMAGRSVSYHKGELRVRLERFNATWR